VFGNLGDFIGMTFLITFGLSIVIILLVVFTIIYVFRRALPSGKAAAQEELRQRLARGEISPTEYEATMDALRNQR